MSFANFSRDSGREAAPAREVIGVLEISPELVLVDPELAKVARLLLAEDAVLRPSPPVRIAHPAEPSPRLTRVTASARVAVVRSMPTVLLLSLLLNLLFAASLFAGDSNAPTLETTTPTVTHTSVSVSKSAAERAVLTLVARRAVDGNAPKALVNSATGLLRNNVLAVCRRGTDRSFVCVVRPPGHRGGLYVRYRPAEGNRPAGVVWLGYRVSG